MKFRNASFVSVFVMTLVWIAGAASAQTQIYLSYSGFGDGNTFANDSKAFSVGDLASAYIWVDSETTINGASDFTVESSDATLVTLEDGELFNSEIVAFPGADQQVFDDRWGSISTNLSDERIQFVSSNIGVGGVGIRPLHDGSGPLLDLLYDPMADAFLYGRVDFVVTAEGQGMLNFTEDSLAFDSILGVYAPTISGVAIVVSTVPEPVSFVATLPLAMLVFRRRR